MSNHIIRKIFTPSSILAADLFVKQENLTRDELEYRALLIDFLERSPTIQKYRTDHEHLSIRLQSKKASKSTFGYQFGEMRNEQVQQTLKEIRTYYETFDQQKIKMSICLGGVFEQGLNYVLDGIPSDGHSYDITFTPRHLVKLSKNMLVSQTHITQKDFHQVMGYLPIEKVIEQHIQNCANQTLENTKYYGTPSEHLDRLYMQKVQKVLTELRDRLCSDLLYVYQKTNYATDASIKILDTKTRNYLTYDRNYEPPELVITDHPINPTKIEWNPRYKIEITPDDRPVNYTTFDEIAEFCNRLSEIQGLEPCYDSWKIPPHIAFYFEIEQTSFVPIKDRNGYRLPTNAEWEYLATMGRYLEYAFPIEDILMSQKKKFNLQDIMWSKESIQTLIKEQEKIYKKIDAIPFLNGIKDVGTKLPNQWLLYDMNGNVAEFTNDTINPIFQESQKGTSGYKELLDKNIGGYSELIKNTKKEPTHLGLAIVDPLFFNPFDFQGQITKGGNIFEHDVNMNNYYFELRARHTRRKTSGFRILRNI